MQLLSNRFLSIVVLLFSVFFVSQTLALSPEEKIRTEALLTELGNSKI